MRLATVLLGVAAAAAAAAARARPDSAAEFELFTRYSAAAYCKRLHDGLGQTDVCNKEVCSGMKNTSTVIEFRNDGAYRVGGYIAVNPSQKHIVVVFKGTNSLFDVITDVSKTLVECDMGEGCLVHYGFLTAFNLVRSKVETTLTDLRKMPEHKKWRIVVAGHSLGAAVANVAAGYLRKRKIPCDLYSYGAPRVGNEAFARYVVERGNKLGGFTARITNGYDLVTAIPRKSELASFQYHVAKWFHWGGGGTDREYSYTHIYPEYWYRDGLSGSSGQYAGPRSVCHGEGQCGSSLCLGLSWWQMWAWWQPWGWGSCSFVDHTTYVRGFRPCAGSAPKRQGKVMDGDEQPPAREPPDLPDPQEFVPLLRGL